MKNTADNVQMVNAKKPCAKFKKKRKKEKKHKQTRRRNDNFPDIQKSYN